jgi:hypothetical protein
LAAGTLCVPDRHRALLTQGDDRSIASLGRLAVPAPPRYSRFWG